MGNIRRSEPGLFGSYTHYDEYGNKVGSSSPGLFGGYINYDKYGNKTGNSYKNFSGGYSSYDNYGNYIGSSYPNMFGGYTHRDSSGNRTGSSDPYLFGGYKHNEGGEDGCYVATCVYGSYDCPQVWILRRFRDNCLKQNFFGRLFVRAYYAVSPSFVKYFGGIKAVRKFFRKILDPFVCFLHEKGFNSEPYEDKKG